LIKKNFFSFFALLCSDEQSIPDSSGDSDTDTQTDQTPSTSSLEDELDGLDAATAEYSAYGKSTRKFFLMYFSIFIKLTIPSNIYKYLNHSLLNHIANRSI